MRLIKWTLATWILGMAAISLALLIGRSQPAPESLRRLHLTDCELPCWIGILPGKTTVAEAKEQILRTFKNTDAYEVEFHEANSKLTFGITDKSAGRELYRVFGDITEFEQSTMVDRLRFGVQGSDGKYLSFADLYPAAGNPQYVQEFEDYYSQSLITYYDGRVLVFMYPLRCGAISTRSKLQFVISQRVPHTSQRDLNFIRWKGFNQCYQARSYRQ
jgi:hypothetical protein